MDNINFRKCKTDDLGILQQISFQTFADTYQHKNTPENFNTYITAAFNEQQLKKELQNKSSHFFFVYLGKILVGYLKLNELSAQAEKQSDDALEVERIYLYKKFHGKGLGRKMIDFAIHFAKTNNKSRVWLGVWTENPAAIGFYKKMGFVEFGKHVFAVGDDEQMDLMLELKLE